MDLDEYIEMRIEETKLLMDPIHKSIHDWEELLRGNLK